MTQDEDGMLPGDVESYVRQLMAVVASAGQVSEPAGMAATFAEAQRVTASGLRVAVQVGLEQGLSWRELAAVLGIPASTLHRQYHKGLAIHAALDGVPGLIAPASTPEDGPPLAIDRFFGRERELAEGNGLLRQNRLVSVVGPVGVGKTRLALELVRRVRAEYPGGVRWVNLAPVTQGRLVGPAISTVVNPAGAVRDVRPAVAGAAEAGAVLVVLDNCEHLLASVRDVVVELGAAIPALHVLTTSRGALRAPGEAVMPLAPLPRATGPGVVARSSDAVRLFAHRARDVRPDFDTDRWVAVIAAICDRLDGLPLAIELAARQSDILTPDLLLPELAQRFDLLVGSQRGVADRHQSLRGAIQWSYDLLDDLARTVFARLCVLPGGFDQHTAAAVTGDLGLAPAQLRALLAGLTRTSMVSTDPHEPGRFRILESLRAFGQEILTGAGDLVAVQTRLLQWLVTLQGQLAGCPWGGELTGLYQRISAEADNLRYAVDVAAALQHPHHPKLTLLFAHFLTTQQDLAEIRGMLAGVLASPLTSSADRVLALVAVADHDGAGNHHEASIRHASEAVELARSLGEAALLTRARVGLMAAYARGEDATRALAAGAELIELLSRTGQTNLLGRVLNNQAWSYAAAGDITAAHAAISESLATYDELADRNLPLAERFASHFGIAVLNTAAVVAIMRNDATATDYTVAILTSPFRFHKVIVSALEYSAVLAQRRGNHAAAITLAAGAARAGLPKQAFWAGQLEAAIGAARRAAGPATTRAASALGRTLTIIQLIEYTLSGALPADNGRAGGLTPREYEVAQHVARGLTNSQIAAAMSMSERSVVSHLASIRKRLDLSSRVAVAVWASRAAEPAGMT